MGVEVLIKALAFASNILLQLAPMRTVLQVKNREAVDVGGLFWPVLTLLVSAVQWTFYGGFAYATTGAPGFLTLVYANVPGIFLGVYYVAILSEYGGIRSYLSFGAMFLAELGLVKFLPSSQCLVVFGSCAAMISILISLATVPDVLKRVRRQGSSSSVESGKAQGSTSDASGKVNGSTSDACASTDVVLAALVASAIWLICGVLLGDPWVVWPNAVGIIVGCAQYAVLWAVTSVEARYDSALQMKAKADSGRSEALVPNANAETVPLMACPGET